MKLFYFSGMQYGRYPKNEVMNLARYIAVSKQPMLSWRQQHPYVCVHRVEDQTDVQLIQEEGPLVERKVHLYGYTYGARLRVGQFVHFCGVGDFPIAGIEAYTDPCPLPEEA